MPPNFAALAHHYVVVSFGVYHIVRYNLLGGEPISVETLETLVPFTLGYFAADILFYAIPEAVTENKVEYLIHHVFGIVINLTSLSIQDASLSLRAFCSTCLLAELSSIFFITGYILRSTSYKDSKIIDLLNYIFCLLFFVLRIVGLTYHAYLVWGEFDSLGQFYKWGGMFPVLVMQFWWQYKIILQVIGNKNKNNNKDLKSKDGKQD